MNNQELKTLRLEMNSLSNSLLHIVKEMETALKRVEKIEQDLKKDIANATSDFVDEVEQSLL